MDGLGWGLVTIGITLAGILGEEAVDPESLVGGEAWGPLGKGPGEVCSPERKIFSLDGWLVGLSLTSLLSTNTAISVYNITDYIFCLKWRFG